jgi:hypothetical protein
MVTVRVVVTVRVAGIAVFIWGGGRSIDGE